MARRRSKSHPEAWVVEDDEFHPDPRYAAKFADENARNFTLAMYQRRLKRLQDKPAALTPGEAQMFIHLNAELKAVKQAINDSKEDE